MVCYNYTCIVYTKFMGSCRLQAVSFVAPGSLHCALARHVMQLYGTLQHGIL